MMMLDAMGPTFDPEFAAPADWAEMYRARGIQVIPGRWPMKTAQDKCPDAAKWKEFQSELVSDALFHRWFPPTAKPNMGVIAGQASGNLVVIDLDEYKPTSGAIATAWWRDLTGGVEPETWQQRTGGGGRQIFFRLPKGVQIGNASAAAMAIDIKCQGGFALIPPTVHFSGNSYEWLEGCEPWAIELETIPPHILAAVQEFCDDYARVDGAVRTPDPATELNPFGKRIDGREAYMRNTIWARVVDLRRKGDKPEGEALEDELRDLWAGYERHVATRIPGVENSNGLEQEGRGVTALREHFKRALKQWDGKVAREAAKPGKPSPFADEPDRKSRPLSAPEGVFEALDVRAIKIMPDPKWFVQGLVTETALGFVFGPPGCGKSFITIGMALSIAAGLKEWWGRAIQKHGAVIYVSSEGQGDLKFRIRAWEIATGVNADDVPFYLVRQPINFMAETDVAKLIRTVEWVANEHGVEPVAVIVDTVSRVLPGADENLQKDMTLFISACDAIRERFGATVIGVHHTSRNGNLRGSTVFDGAGDFLIQIEREEGAKIGSLRAKKIKAAEDGWEEPFTLESIPMGDIAGHSSLFAKPFRGAALEPADDLDIEKRRAILAFVTRRLEEGSPLSSKEQTHNEGRFFPSVVAKQFAIKPKLAREIMQEWLDNEVLAYRELNKKTKLKGLVVIASI